MLAKEDLQFIEKFLAYEFNMPDVQAPSKEEQILWTQRMKDPEFASHVQIERELYTCLSKQESDDEQHLRSTLKALIGGKHSFSKHARQHLHWDLWLVLLHLLFKDLRLSESNVLMVCL